MDSLLSRLNGPTPRLILVALASSTLTALTILSIQTLKRDAALSSLKKEAALVPPSNIHRLNSIGAEDFKQETVKERVIASRAKRGEYDEELIMEQLARNRSFFGDEGLGKIRKGFVIVVGAGGVGSWAATMLARSGIGIPPVSCLRN
jgi:tRNA threonylcarbamoyladenosine dehydratase